MIEEVVLAPIEESPELLCVCDRQVPCHMAKRLSRLLGSWMGGSQMFENKELSEDIRPKRRQRRHVRAAGGRHWQTGHAAIEAKVEFFRFGNLYAERRVREHLKRQTAG